MEVGAVTAWNTEAIIKQFQTRDKMDAATVTGRGVGAVTHWDKKTMIKRLQRKWVLWRLREGCCDSVRPRHSIHSNNVTTSFPVTAPILFGVDFLCFLHPNVSQHQFPQSQHHSRNRHNIHFAWICFIIASAFQCVTAPTHNVTTPFPKPSQHPSRLELCHYCFCIPVGQNTDLVFKCDMVGLGVVTHWDAEAIIKQLQTR